MGSPTARAASLAAQLAAATGQEPRTSLAGDRLRIEVDLPESLTETACRVVLIALGTADRYGYERVNGHQYVWADLRQEETEQR